MEVKLNIPTKLSEITLKQYKKFLIIHEENTDVNFIQAKMIEIFCGISHTLATLKLKKRNMVSFQTQMI